MYPKTLPTNPGKNYWHNTDSFRNHPGHLTKSFLHQNYQIGMHAHEFFEVNIVLSGTGCHYIESTSMPIGAGNVFVIPPNVLHGYYCHEKLDVFHILVHPDFVRRYHEELTGLPGYSLLFEIEPYLRQVYPKRFFLQLGYDEMTALQPEVQLLHRFNIEEQYIAQNIGVLNLLSRFCLRLYNAQTPADPDWETADSDILRVLEYIHSNLDTKISVGILLSIARMSNSTFNRHFRKMVHQSPADYILHCRIKKAHTMMEEANYNRTEIAQACGFYDISHMNKYVNRRAAK